MTIDERYKFFVDYFEQTMPEVATELRYTTPFELLVAVILSAQCTDKRVNTITPSLFERYPDAQAMSLADANDIYQYIKSCSYPRNKSKYLAEMARMLYNEYGGAVPSDIEEMQRLPGVGRKTANVVASVVFGQATMPVDTHVYRVSARLGLTRGSKTPLDTERQLTRHLSQDKLSKAHHWLILHGRYVCTARNPHCSECGLTSICLFNQKH